MYVWFYLQMFCSTCVMWSLSHFSYCIHFSWLHTRQWHTAAWHHGIPQQTYLSGKKDFVHLTFCGSAVAIPPTPRSTKIHFWTLEFVSSSVFSWNTFQRRKCSGTMLRLEAKKPPAASDLIILKWKDFLTQPGLPQCKPSDQRDPRKRDLTKGTNKDKKKKNSKRSSITVVLHESELYGRQARQKPLLHKRHVKALLEFTEGWWWHQHAVGVSSAVETRGLVRGWGECWMEQSTEINLNYECSRVLRPWKWAKGSPSCKAVMYKAKKKGWHWGNSLNIHVWSNQTLNPIQRLWKNWKYLKGDLERQGQNTSISRWLEAGTAAKVGYEYRCHYNSSAFQFRLCSNTFEDSRVILFFLILHSQKTNFSKT